MDYDGLLAVDADKRFALKIRDCALLLDCSFG